MQLPKPEDLLAQITKQIQSQLVLNIQAGTNNQANSALVGIHSGGVWLMQRILKSIHGTISDGAIASSAIPFGTLDAAMYRDDYAKRGLKAAPKPPNIAFDVSDKHIILIDDIFHTGRTTRAAMNELFDYGRPASITLAVLINRGGAQLPIAPQIVGANLALKSNQNLQLSHDTSGILHLSLEVNDA